VILDLGFVRHRETQRKRDRERERHTHTHTLGPQEELEFSGGEIFASALLGCFGNGERRSWEEGGKRSHGGRDSVQNFCFGQLSSSRNRDQLDSCLLVVQQKLGVLECLL
jgi:hypothetical protein